ncbi:FAD-binding domain-containing protein [Ophiocordyceps camponoti-floridani]|uniref:FAD-binding domain-containing protein n=1 Tax=Ophiocordyceps camponoti-floridani TaxID=2030778 RepID=A0A8H4VFP4_9HYPO|nr:FAD-binding domain-containing protein [Ophiocordyceps camponoti-floridani]
MPGSHKRPRLRKPGPAELDVQAVDAGEEIRWADELDLAFIVYAGGNHWANSSSSSLVLTATWDCVSFLGALLGGGVGYLTGQYGLLVDTVLSIDVVLADGSLRTVTEETEPDLWWAPSRGGG